MSTSESLWLTLPIAVALGALHLAAPRLRRLPGVSEAAMTSFAGGIASAYVFLHLLPDLAEGNKSIGKALRNAVDPTPLLDLAIFTIALLGFLTFYGIERLVRRPGPGVDEPSAGLFRLQVGAFVLYNVLITYTMPLRLRTGVDFALLFSAAMGLHFVLTDRGLSEHFPRRFDRGARLVLALALVLGWFFVAVAAPVNTVVVSALNAFLGGSILLNVFKEELPEGRASSFGWFATGCLGYAGLLALVTELSG